jgi:hypothetical protein
LKAFIMSKGFAFDVGTVLGIGTPIAQLLPESTDGEIVLRLSVSISLIGLRDSDVGKLLMQQDSWYEKYVWCRQVFPAGAYRLLVPVPESFGKNFPEQQELLGEGEKAAPVVLVAAALLCMQRSENSDPLNGKWSRCAEPTAPSRYAVVAWRNGRVSISDCWDEFYDHSVGMSALRTS